MDIKIAKSDQHVAKIKVIGVGGCGGNLVSYMSKRPTSGVEFVAVNTDSQALASMEPNVECIQIGGQKTGGLGSGGVPEVAREAAQNESERLREVISGMDMVFVVAGMGKGTGTGASPVVADIARELGVLTVALVVTPFNMENRTKIAEEGVLQLSKRSDSLIVAPNERLMEVLGANAPMNAAYLAAHAMLYNAVSGISDIINKHGVVNVDFNDVRTAMSGKGKAVIGSASAHGEGRAERAAESALRSDLMEHMDLSGASHVLLNISGGGVTLGEMNGIVELVKEHVTDLRGNITPGFASDEEMGDEMRVTIIVTGVMDKYQPKILQPAADEGAAADGGFFTSGRGGRTPAARTGTADGGGGLAARAHLRPTVLKRQTN